MGSKKALNCFLVHIKNLVSPISIFIFSLLCQHFLIGFETKPWLEAPFEIYSTSSFLYRKYPSVNGGYNPKNYHSNDRFYKQDFNVGFSSDIDVGAFIEFADTRKQKLGTQAVGIQGRYQWLDDICGDLLATTTSFSVSYASTRSLKDVSCPYSGPWNFLLGQSIGKEFSYSERGFYSTYLFLGVGQATIGMPWIFALANFKNVFCKIHSIETFAEGYFGFGKRKKVDVSEFYGWGRIFHQSVDLGLRYTCYFSEIWGHLSFSYAYRVFSKNYPEHANSFDITYQIPFSLF